MDPVAFPPFPYPLNVVRGVDALRELASMRERMLLPVIIGDPDDVADVVERHGLGDWAEHPEQVVVDANDIDGRRMLEDLVRTVAEATPPGAVDLVAPGEVAVPSAAISAVRQGGMLRRLLRGSDEAVEAVESPRATEPVDEIDVEDAPPWVAIVEIPGTRAWEALARLCFGAVDHDLEPAMIAAAVGHWEVAHGITLVRVTGDLLEVDVARPPTGDAELDRLAWEHYALCPDVVEHGGGSLRSYRDGLAHATHWSFWWG